MLVQMTTPALLYVGIFVLSLLGGPGQLFAGLLFCALDVFPATMWLFIIIGVTAQVFSLLNHYWFLLIVSCLLTTLVIWNSLWRVAVWAEENPRAPVRSGRMMPPGPGVHPHELELLNAGAVGAPAGAAYFAGPYYHRRNEWENWEGGVPLTQLHSDPAEIIRQTANQAFKVI